MSQVPRPILAREYRGQYSSFDDPQVNVPDPRTEYRNFLDQGRALPSRAAFPVPSSTAPLQVDQPVIIAPSIPGKQGTTGATGATGGTGPTGSMGPTGTAGATVLGSASGGGSAGSTSYVNLSPNLTVTVTCDGNPRVIQITSGYIANGTGGASTLYAALYMDATTLLAELGGSTGIVGVPSGGNAPMEFSVAYTAPTGSRTFNLKVKSTAGGTVGAGGQISVF